MQGQYKVFTDATKVPFIKAIKLSDGFKIKFAGYYNEREKIFRTKRNDSLIHHNSNSIAFNYEIVNKFDIKLFLVEYAGKFLFITKEYLMKIGKLHQYKTKGYELQVFAEISEFSESEKEAKNKFIPDTQLALFS